MRNFLAVTTLTCAIAFPAFGQTASDTIAPETATGTGLPQSAIAERHMVAAANPHAVAAGLEILRTGGSAADALVTVQTVLGLVEPQSSGIGGGAFLVWYDASTGEVSTIDGRETAPAAATEELFLGADGKPLPFFEAVVGGRSVGTPGVVDLMATIHERHGKLDWARLFQPAIEMAEAGFAISPRLAAQIVDDAGRLDEQPSTRAYFHDAQGRPLEAGAVRDNPAYAETLRRIAELGPAGFYEGDVAAAMIEAVAGHPGNPGLLSLEDLSNYQAKERPAICAPYRQYEVCGMGPPSSGALTVGQILGMVAHFDLPALGPDDPESWRIIGDATRLAFADRGRYMADQDFVRMPKGLLDRNYLEARAALIRRPTALPQNEVSAGDPPWDRAELRFDGISPELPATTHFVIVDGDGNIASMTSSVESGFGARLMAAGFLLNNQLTDFSFVPNGEDGTALANRVEPGKRPRSSMSPTIVLREGRPVLAIGSPGGSAIIPYVANAIIAVLDWGMSPTESVSRPHLVNRFGAYDLEAGTVAEEMADDLSALGYETRAVALTSGLHVVAIAPGRLEGAADPRREGAVAGD